MAFYIFYSLLIYLFILRISHCTFTWSLFHWKRNPVYCSDDRSLRVSFKNDEIIYFLKWSISQLKKSRVFRSIHLMFFCLFGGQVGSKNIYELMIHVVEYRDCLLGLITSFFYVLVIHRVLKDFREHYCL